MQDKKRVGDLNTIITLSLVCAIVGVASGSKAVTLAGIVLLAVGIFIPRLATLISSLWLGFAARFGHIMNHIAFSVTYFFILTPFAFAQKIFGKHRSKIPSQQEDESFFVKREHLFGLKDFEKPW